MLTILAALGAFIWLRYVNQEHAELVPVIKSDNINEFVPRLNAKLSQLSAQLGRRADLYDIRFSGGATVAHLSAMYSANTILRYVLKQPYFDVDVPASDLRTPLHVAAGSALLAFLT